MKTFLVEFENLVTKDPIIMVMHGRNEQAVFDEALRISKDTGYICDGGFDMYPIYREADGTLSLGEVL